MAPRRDAGGHERLVDGEVGVGQAHVLAHHGDVQLACAGVLRLQEGPPRGELDLAGSPIFARAEMSNPCS